MTAAIIVAEVSRNRRRELKGYLESMAQSYASPSIGARIKKMSLPWTGHPGMFEENAAR
jgi:hypothetical protein